MICFNAGVGAAQSPSPFGPARGVPAGAATRPGESRPSVATTAPAVRKAADGTVFPPADDPKLLLDLPLVKRALGSLPEDVCPKLYSLQSRKPPVIGWQQTLIKNGVGFSHYDFIGRNGLGAQLLLIGVQQGRVQRIALYSDSLSDPIALAKLKPLLALDPDAVRDGDSFTIRTNGVRITATVGGTRTVTTPQPIEQHMDGSSSQAPPLIERFPSVIEVYVNAVDWLLVYHPEIPPEVAAAIRDGRLTIGMTQGEASVAMDRYAAHLTNVAADSFSIDYGDAALDDDHVVIHPRVTAYFAHGKIVRFTNW